MTSLHGDASRITGPLWGASTGHGRFKGTVMSIFGVLVVSIHTGSWKNVRLFAISDAMALGRSKIFGVYIMLLSDKITFYQNPTVNYQYCAEGYQLWLFYIKLTVLLRPRTMLSQIYTSQPCWHVHHQQNYGWHWPLHRKPLILKIRDRIEDIKGA